MTSEMLFACKVCGLHYKSKEIAAQCYAWCSEHNACNLRITRHSIERSSKG